MRLIRVPESGTGAQHGVGHGVDGIVLSDDALVDAVGECQQARAITFGEFGRRDARPAGDDLRDLLGADGFAN